MLTSLVERDTDSRGMTPAEQVERIAKSPLIHQPGTMWEYSMAVDIGRVVEAASAKRLATFMDDQSAQIALSPPDPAHGDSTRSEQ
jgi:CubicO group peptidase (beta-lactamase class C family)